MKLFATCFILVECLAAAGPQVTAPALNKGGAVPAATVTQEASNSKAINASVAPKPVRAKLDVGFASFEKGMNDQILVSIQKATESAHWSSDLQLGCRNNATPGLSQGLKSQVTALKQAIGKTWMSLPDDDAKNSYVAQLQSAYAPIFKDITDTIDTHLQRSLKRMSAPTPYHRKALTQAELLKSCVSYVTGNIADEHCYDLAGSTTKKAGSSAKKAISFLETKGDAPKNFCMPSVFETMVRRLKDSQGLIGMTMQFEAKSLSLQPASGALDALTSQLSK